MYITRFAGQYVARMLHVCCTHVARICCTYVAAQVAAHVAAHNAAYVAALVTAPRGALFLFFYLVSRRPTPQSLFDLNVLGSTPHKVHGLPTPHKLYDAQLWFFGVSLRHWSLFDAFRRDPLFAGYHRAFLSALGQVKLFSGCLHFPRCLTAP